MSIVKTAVNPLRQSQHSKKSYLVDNLSTNSQQYNCDTCISTKSFEQFIKSPSLQLNNQNGNVINEQNINNTQTNEVYNVPWDYKNKLKQQQQQQQPQPQPQPQQVHIQQQSQQIQILQQPQQSLSTQIMLKPPSIQPPPLPPVSFKSPPVPPQPQQEYCAPWDLKLQEERFKHLSITTNNTPSSTITKTTTLNQQESPLVQQQLQHEPTEYSPPWDQKQQNILFNQLKSQQEQEQLQQQTTKLSASCSSSSSLSSINSLKINSPSQQQQQQQQSPKLSQRLPNKYIISPSEIKNQQQQQPLSSQPSLQVQLSDIATGGIDNNNKFNSLDSNSSSNVSFDDAIKPLIKPRQSFRQSTIQQQTPVQLLQLIQTTSTSLLQPKQQQQIVVLPTTSPIQPPPLPATPAYMVTLEKQCWFHGKITRKQAEYLLQEQPTGSYLVRQSESGNTNDFSLSLVSGSGCVHMRICLKNGEFILGQCSQPFTSIIKMIEHYSKIEVPIKGAQHVKLKKPITV